MDTRNERSGRDPQAFEADDRELEQLLSEAYDAPNVPRSLLKRIDRGVAAEWRRSPQLTETRLPDAPSRRSRWARSWPIAGAVAAIVAMAFLASPGSRSYGWSAVVEAMAEQGVVQVVTDDGMRWLALSAGLAGEEKAGESRILDVSQQSVMTLKDGEAHVRRQPHPAGPGEHERLAVAFLTGSVFDEQDWQRLKGVQLVDENWDSVHRAGREVISLQIRLRTVELEQLELELTLDPETRLPLACALQEEGLAIESLAVSYPEIDAVRLRERAIPVAMAVVDVDASDRIPAPVANRPRTDSDSEPTAAAPEVESAGPEDPPLFGSASQWGPVAVVDRTSSEILQDINAQLARLWRENGIEPTTPADDEELLRRVYLDLTGRTPTVYEVRAFLQDPAEDRYETLVDRLLESPDHASHLATVWRTFLIPEGVDLEAFGGVQQFDRWLAERIAANDSYDEIVRDLLLAEGRLSRSGPLLFYSAVKLDPEQLASRTARVFLGMRLECAQCHDHPFEPWTQQEFWGFAAFFAQISRPRGTLESVSTVMRVHDVDHGEVMLPDSETVVPPEFLNGAELRDDGAETARRVQLADWLTSADNPYFARATANRVWAHMFGKGIVDPVDDFGSQHRPKSPELLELLAGHFINTGFDLQELFRTAALTRSYRLSSGAETTDERRLEWFAQMNIKTLTAEQIYDCITVATMLDPPPSSGGYEFNVDRIGNSERDLFVQQFRTPAGRTTEYLGGIPQALTLMNGTLIEGATGLSSSGLLKSLEAPFFTNRQRIEILYFATLSRRPRQSEWELLQQYIPEAATGTDLQEGLADLLWAILNSAEFTLNH